MRRILFAATTAAVLACFTPSTRAQNAYGGAWAGANYGGMYAAPGNYGTTWGYPSMGFPRTYSVYTSPFGGGYGYGYGPSAIMPGYGVGLWRPGFAAPGYVYSGSYYGMFPNRYWPTWSGGSPWVGGYGGPIGGYAPALGPASYYGW